MSDYLITTTTSRGVKIIIYETDDENEFYLKLSDLQLQGRSFECYKPFKPKNVKISL